MAPPLLDIGVKESGGLNFESPNHEAALPPARRGTLSVRRSGGAHSERRLLAWAIRPRPLGRALRDSVPLAMGVRSFPNGGGLSVTG